MAQGSLHVPTVGPDTPTNFAGQINTLADALLSKNSGSSPPANYPTSPGAATQFQDWNNTSDSNLVVETENDGSAFVKKGVLDTFNHLWLPKMGGGSGLIAAGATTDIGSKPQFAINVTGGGTIALLGGNAALQAGECKLLTFNAATKFTNSASLICTGAIDMNFIAGDFVLVKYEGASTWTVVIRGSTLVFTGSAIGVVTLASNTNDWAPAGITGATRILVTASSAINLSGMTSGLEGRVLILDVQGSSNPITVLPASGLSAAANQFILPRNLIMRASNMYAFIWSTAWHFVGALPGATTTTNVTATGSNTVATPAGATRARFRAAAGGGGSTVGTGGDTTIAGAGISVTATVKGGLPGSAAGTPFAGGGSGGAGGALGTGDGMHMAGNAGGNGGSATAGNAGTGGAGGPGGGNPIFGGGATRDVSAAANSGAGAGGTSRGGGSSADGGGGSGGAVDLVVNNPSGNYTIVIGAGGTGGSFNGGSGRCWIEWDFT